MSCGKTHEQKVGACAQCAFAQKEKMRIRKEEASERARSAKERLEQLLDDESMQQAEEAARARRARAHESKLLEQAREAEERTVRLRAEAKKEHERAHAIECKNKRARAELQPQRLHEQYCMLVNATKQEHIRLHAAQEGLAKEQADAVAELLSYLPFKAVSNNRSGPAGVRLCGMRAPAPLPSRLSEPLPPREAASAIGRLQLVLELAASVLGLPLLHAGVFQTETSAVWLPDSALRQLQPSPGGGPFLLHMHGGNELRPELPAPTQTPASASASPGHAAISPLSPSLAVSMTPAPFSPSRQSFRKGVSVLHRSAAQLVAGDPCSSPSLQSHASPAAALGNALQQLAADGASAVDTPSLMCLTIEDAGGGEFAPDEGES
jgi:hypothetical protein